MFVVWTMPSPYYINLGVPCLVSTPSLKKELGSALAVKHSPNLRNSTS